MEVIRYTVCLILQLKQLKCWVSLYEIDQEINISSRVSNTEGKWEEKAEFIGMQKLSTDANIPEKSSLELRSFKTR